MAWIEGEESSEFVVAAPEERVRHWFENPSEFKRAFPELETCEEVAPNTWRWLLREKSEKGITFQADYTVKYHSDGVSSTWEPVRGNMKSSGRVRIERVDENSTRVHYRERIAVDLPIPGMMAKIFSPIVSREIRAGVRDFLKASKSHLESE